MLRKRPCRICRRWFQPHPGFKYHRLENSKDKNFWSIRVNDDIRIIIHRHGDTNVLCYTDHHDASYRWAEKRRLDVHPDTGAAQFVVIDERIEEVVKRVVREVEEELPVFGKHEPDYLQALGVPVELLDAVRYIGPSQLAELIDLLPEEAAERLLDLAEGRPVPRPQHLEGDPFAHPDAQRRFKVIDSNDELRQALEAGWEKWVVFLHPDQRAAVDRSFSGPAKVSGSAGTGKTVVALHRAAHLARAGQGRVLLTTFSSTLAARLEQHLELLLPRADPARANIEIVHLHKLARDIWVGSNERKLKFSDRKSLKQHLDRADRATGGSGFDLGFLRAEWEHVVEPNDIDSWEQYRRVSRAGRGTALGARQRKRLWEVFAKTRASTAAAGLLSWDRVCHEVAELLAQRPELQFRHVIADEVQDFGQPELRLLRALVREQRDDLFMAGDPGQRIYKRRSSWAAVGINVRGRATRLRVNYRTTEQPPPPMTDAYNGDPTRSSLRVEGQSTYGRPGTDIYVRGHAWAPGGRPVPRSEIHVRVGPCRRSAVVLGDRIWVRSIGTLTATRPTPFERVPILWERSFGGTAARARGRRAEIAARNPVGRGLYDDRAAADGQPLPNFEEPRQLITRFGDLPEPVGFGPIARHWQPRLSYAGTYDQTWMETRAPLWPADMDERLFFAAAPGLQAQPHLRGGEPVALLGLHPDGPIEFELPTLALTARFEFRRRVVERALVLDAVDIDADQMRLALILRTAVQADDDLLELQSILVRELASWERAS